MMIKKIFWQILIISTLAFVLLAAQCKPVMAQAIGQQPQPPPQPQPPQGIEIVGFILGSCHFDGLYAIPGDIRRSRIIFTTNGQLDATKATLVFNLGLGEFEVEELECRGDDCSGLVTGLPDDYRGFFVGKLIINDGERVCTASKIQVPPDTKPPE